MEDKNIFNVYIKDLTGKELEYSLNNFLAEIQGEIRKIERTKRKGLKIDKYLEKIDSFNYQIDGIERVIGLVKLNMYLRLTVRSLEDFIKGKENYIRLWCLVKKDEDIYLKTLHFTPEQMVQSNKDVEFSLKIAYTEEDYNKFEKYFDNEKQKEE